LWAHGFAEFKSRQASSTEVRTRSHPRRVSQFAWLSFLALFSILSYSFANWLTGLRNQIPSIVLPFDHRIPFLAWTIIPYLSLHLFFGAAFFICRTNDEVQSLGCKLLTAQLAAVACFLVSPLRFSFNRPAVEGVLGYFYQLLDMFDRPFNQAPSLHIAVLTILSVHYGHILQSRSKILMTSIYAWFLLIGCSVLTTYQHHLIDLPTGVLLGALCIGVWSLASFHGDQKALQ
jgi:membrane-associated phospholipid phosphatase